MQIDEFLDILSTESIERFVFKSSPNQGALLSDNQSLLVDRFRSSNRTHKVIKNSYCFQETLGTGSFAVVKKAVRKKDGMVFAVKIIQKKKLSQEELETVDDEIEIMNKIKHKNIVGLYEFYESSKYIYMVLEFLSGGELFDRIIEKGQYSEKNAALLVRDVATALLYLHENNIVHRDLKPENLIYANDEENSPIKITDFGLSKYLRNEESMTTACGTPGYVAPEILKNEKYDNRVDAWSLGVIIYILLCGFPPFYSENTTILYTKIKSGQFDFPEPYWNDISDDAKNLIRKLLTVHPEDRYSISDILNDPWISQNKASDKPLNSNVKDRLMKYQTKKKLNNGVKMIMAINRLKRLIET